jgi:prevent-host-death family protein
MEVTATEAKNRLGQMLDHAQREPVVIEKQGRRHSVLISAETYDRLCASAPPPMPRLRGVEPRTAAEFYAKHKEWVDACNERVATHGLWNEEFRTW